MTILAPSRTVRHPGPVRLNARDNLIFALVERGPVHVGHVATLCGMSKEVAKRRLRKLKDAGYLSVEVLAMEAKSRYLLTRRGAEVLARVSGRSKDDIRIPRGLGRSDLEHFDQAADLVIALEVAGAKTKLFRVVRALFEPQIRRLLGNPDRALIPDGLVEIDLDGDRLVLVVEADRGGENPSWVATHKAAPYTSLAATGGTILGTRDFLVLFTVPSLRRVHKLAAACWEAGINEDHFFFAVAANLTAENVLTAVWLTPKVVNATALLTPTHPLQKRLGARTRNTASKADAQVALVFQRLGQDAETGAPRGGA
jgi:predicted transcriptional regulator